MESDDVVKKVRVPMEIHAKKFIVDFMNGKPRYDEYLAE